VRPFDGGWHAWVVAEGGPSWGIFFATTEDDDDEEAPCANGGGSLLPGTLPFIELDDPLRYRALGKIKKIFKP
jgi:hypothetical protein